MKKMKGLGQIGGGAATDVGLSVMQLGMITGLHAAISPSVFTFACFAKKPEECAIAKRTLWISLAATTATNVATLAVFKRWAPAILGQVAAFGLFGLGMHAVAGNEDSPEQTTMDPRDKILMGRRGRIGGLGYFNPGDQPREMHAQYHWLDRRWPERYSYWWKPLYKPVRVKDLI